MSKYIELERQLIRLYRLNLDCGEVIKQFLLTAPTADVVEVVRCKDCKYLVRSDGICKVLSNNYEPPVYVDDDDFCSRGERREDEQIH